MELSNTFVCVMGMGIVFIGLICLVLLCVLMSKIVALTTPAKPFEESAKVSAAPIGAVPAAAVIPNRAELVAAISAAIAEDLGDSIDSFRIKSIKRV